MLCPSHMSTATNDVAEFFHQLSLLVNSDLPLPTSLQQLAAAYRDRTFKDVIEELATTTAQGKPFSEALQRHPELFHPTQIHLIKAGELTNTLSLALNSVAQFAKFQHNMLSRIKHAAAYPLFSFLAACGIFTFLALNSIPHFADFFAEFGLRNLPPTTRMVFGIAAVINYQPLIAIALYIATIVACIWLFTPTIPAQRVLLRAMRFIPGSMKMASSISFARLCHLLSTFIQYKMPIHDAFRASAALAEDPRAVLALESIADRTENGMDISNAIAEQPFIDPLILLTFRHVPEDALADELKSLGLLFEERIAISSRSAAVLWTTITIAVAATMTGLVILAMFAPLATAVSYMAM